MARRILASKLQSTVDVVEIDGKISFRLHVERNQGDMDMDSARVIASLEAQAFEAVLKPSPKDIAIVPEGYPKDAKLATGILPFFDEGETVLLGYEYRKREGKDFAMEFGGKVENGESFAEAARREAHEESSGILDIPLHAVEEAELVGDYIDYYNPKSGMFYRMYCVLYEKRLDIEGFTANEAHVEKYKVAYHSTEDVIYNDTGILENGTALYPTSVIRYNMLRGKEMSWEK